MRLLFISHSLPPRGRPLDNIGGMQRVATKLHDALASKAQHAPSLRYDALVLRSTWARTHRRVPGFLLKSAARLLQAAYRRSVDVVVFSSMVTASVAVPLQGLLRRAGISTAAIVHGRDVTLPLGLYQWFVPKVFDALDAVLPVSRATGAACLERGLSPAKMQVVPNGIDVSRFPEPDSKAAMRDELTTHLDDPAHPLPSDALLLCSVGRHVTRKGFDWFTARVMPHLPDTVHYWIAGDGPETDAIRTAINRNDLHPRVRLLGRISDANLTRLYRGADLFIMPNVPVPGDMEGFGIVMLEAGLCGTPAVASRLEGIRDVVTPGVNGHLVEPEHPESFLAKIESYVDATERLRGMSDRARRHTAETFAWSAVAETYLHHLHRLHATGSPSDDTVPSSGAPGTTRPG